MNMLKTNNIIALQNALMAIDEWLKSDDIFIVGADGKIIEGAHLECKPFTMTNRLVSHMATDNQDNNSMMKAGNKDGIEERKKMSNQSI